MDFYQWLEMYEQDLDCEVAESGLDRELDFDKEAWLEIKYEVYKWKNKLTT